MLIAHWNRKFQVWQYSVSHSVLLLRSFHPQKYETRIDICFPAVSMMHLQPSYQTLRINEASDEERAEILAHLPGDTAPGRLFLLNDGEGYVHAASCAWHEDKGNHRTPSKFGPLRGTE